MTNQNIDTRGMSINDLIERVFTLALSNSSGEHNQKKIFEIYLKCASVVNKANKTCLSSKEIEEFLKELSV